MNSESLFECVFLWISGQGEPFRPGHLIPAAPFPQKYKGPSRRQTALVQVKYRSWESDWENIQKEFR